MCRKWKKKEKKYCRATNSHQKAHKIQIFFHTNNFHHFHHHHLFHRLLHILSICIIVRASERATGVIMVRETNRIIAVVTFFFPLPSSVFLSFTRRRAHARAFVISQIAAAAEKTSFVDKNALFFNTHDRLVRAARLD